MTIDVDKFDGFKCESCEEHVDAADVESPLYECGNCATVFTRETSANSNHQCPECNKFGSKIAENGCPECNEGELVEFDGWTCPLCGTFFEGPFPNHDCEKDAQVAAEKKRTKIQAKIDQVEVVSANEIGIGDEVYIPNADGETVEQYFDTDAVRLALPVLEVMHEGTKRVQIKFGGMAWDMEPDYQVFRVKKEFKRFSDDS